MIRHVGFGDQNGAGSELIQDCPQQTHQFVCLWQVDAGRGTLFPQIAYRIKAEYADTSFEEQSNNPEEFQQYIRVTEIEIDLIVTECTP